MNTNDGAEAPRYGEMAGIEHHPQITDYVPRRKRAMLATLAGGVGIAAASQALIHGADGIASAAPGVTAAQVSEQIAGGMAAWTSAIGLLAIAGLARLVYSLRRHRVDDVRGRYRVWKWVAWGALAGSVNAVIGLHVIAGGAARAATGWSLTAGASEWWLAPLALVGGWIAVRMMFEISESRSSTAMMIAAAACYGVAAAGSLGWSPAALGGWSGALTGAMPLVGHALALAGMMLFARYVVLDVQGLIDHAPKPVKAPKKVKTKAEPTATAEKETAPPAPTRREQAPAAARLAQHDDNDDEESDDADTDENGQYLSKSERKRLRKQQQRRAA